MQRRQLGVSAGKSYNVRENLYEWTCPTQQPIHKPGVCALIDLHVFRRHHQRNTLDSDRMQMEVFTWLVGSAPGARVPFPGLDKIAIDFDNDARKFALHS